MKNKLYYKVFTLFIVFIAFKAISLESLVNLEDNAQDFVLETKRIEIPGYPNAFNPSIVRWRGGGITEFSHHSKSPLIL